MKVPNYLDITLPYFNLTLCYFCVRILRYNMAMKRLILILFTLSLLVSVTTGVPVAQVLQKKYSFDSAVIHYEIKGGAQNGTEDLYVQGIKTCRVRHVTINALSQTQKQDTIVIDDGSYVYSIDLNEKIGTKMISPRKMLEEMTPEERKKMEETGKVLIKGITGSPENKPVGTEKILGKSCKIYEILGVKSWQWEGIPLKTEMHMMGKNTQIATSIKLNTSIPASRFRVPSGIKIRDITKQQKKLWENNILQNLPMETE